LATAAKVVLSLEDAGGIRCVDVFLRPDGSFGYGEFRRDPEDSRAWAAVGGYEARVFDSAGAALADAQAQVGWLEP